MSTSRVLKKVFQSKVLRLRMNFSLADCDLRV